MHGCLDNQTSSHALIKWKYSFFFPNTLEQGRSLDTESITERAIGDFVKIPFML